MNGGWKKKMKPSIEEIFHMLITFTLQKHNLFYFNSELDVKAST
jgi:hypothetical protein